MCPQGRIVFSLPKKALISAAFVACVGSFPRPQSAPALLRNDEPGLIAKKTHKDRMDIGWTGGRSSVVNGVLLVGYYLVGGLEHFLFFHILGIIIPID